MLAGCAGKPYNYDLSEYIRLGNYKNIEIPTESIEDQMEEDIESLLTEHSTEVEVTDRAVIDGDILNIDYIGTLDGVAFEGGTATGAPLTIGSNTYLEGFEEGLIGAYIGDTVTLNLTFPEDYYQNMDLAGQETVFEVTINSITELIKPALTDEFIAGLEDLDYDTVDELKKILRENIIKNTAWDMLIEDSTIISYPKKDVKKYYDRLINNYEQMTLGYYGMSLYSYIKALGYNQDAFLTEILDSAKNQVLNDMLVYSIARAENITVSEEKYNEFALEGAVSYGYDNVKDYEKAAGKADIERAALTRLIVEYVSGNVTET